VSSGGYDETDYVDRVAAQRRKESGWWGNQTWNTSSTLRMDDLKAVLFKKSNCHNLDSPSVYMYVNKLNGKVYIGIAIKQSLLQRQAQHLCSALHTDGRQVGKFDSTVSILFNERHWDFFAYPMSDSQTIHAQERNLVLMYLSHLHGYNTQIPGGQ